MPLPESRDIDLAGNILPGFIHMRFKFLRINSYCKDLLSRFYIPNADFHAGLQFVVYSYFAPRCTAASFSCLREDNLYIITLLNDSESSSACHLRADWLIRKS